MSGELERGAIEYVSALDSMDVDRMMDATAEDAEGIDEISRRWLRGRDELDAYLRQLIGAVSDVRTQLRDTREQIWGDCGLLTCWLEQDYTIDGNAQHVSAPTTIVLRRERGEWKLALIPFDPAARTAIAPRFARARPGTWPGSRARSARDQSTPTPEALACLHRRGTPTRWSNRANGSHPARPCRHFAAPTPDRRHRVVLDAAGEGARLGDAPPLVRRFTGNGSCGARSVRGRDGGGRGHRRLCDPRPRRAAAVV
jgi:ketosteroid isomerase-like protein